MYPDFAEAVVSPLKGNSTYFLDGPTGVGKSEALSRRLAHLLSSGVPGYAILVLLPDRMAVQRLREREAHLTLGPRGAVELQTYPGMANRLVRLFWPLVAGKAGFASPQRPPVFLNYETAQYLMRKAIAPLLDQGYFEGLTLRPQRLLSQLLDDLNKAALNGYPIAEIENRLTAAWSGEGGRLRYYRQLQECIERFRGYCLEQGVLDISLAIEVFHRYLVEDPYFWRYFAERFRHLLVDDVEEIPPVAQDLVSKLLSDCDSALLTGDRGGGVRIFLGADPEGSDRLRKACRQVISVPEAAAGTRDVMAFVHQLGRHLDVEVVAIPGEPARGVVGLIQTRHRAEMIRQVASQIARLVGEGVAPEEIAAIAPRADGVLRFLLGEGLRAANIPFAAMRRYQTLREEPQVRACLTLAAIAHPGWGIKVSTYAMSEALGMALAPIDPLRAALAARHLWDPSGGNLRSVSELSDSLQQRLGPTVLARYAKCWSWIAAYRAGGPLPFDYFLRRLFGEVLARPELKLEEASRYDHLIASAAAFRRAALAIGLTEEEVGQQYVEMVFSGTVTAQYLSDLDLAVASESIVLVAPIHTYLLSGRTSRFQFWLDIGSLNWWEPLHQPLTHHYVLRRSWPAGKRWTDAVDFAVRNQVLFRLIRGLACRCREGIYLCWSELEERGEFQDSPLLMAVQQVLPGMMK